MTVFAAFTKGAIRIFYETGNLKSSAAFETELGMKTSEACPAHKRTAYAWSAIAFETD
jgi:hypothetical protein